MRTTALSGTAIARARLRMFRGPAQILTWCSTYPASLTKQEVGERAGYEPSGGGFNNALSRLRTLELIEGRGELRASEGFFE